MVGGGGSAHPVGNFQMAASREQLRENFERCRDMEGSLNERLRAFALSSRELEPEIAYAAERLIARLKEADVGANAPRVGEPLPPFLLPDQQGRLVSLEALLEKSPVAVAFHRGHWCPYCRISINALAKAQRAIGEVGQIIAITPERQKFTDQMTSEAAAVFPVLTDMDNGYAMSLELAVWVGDELQNIMSGRGRSLPDYQGNESWTVPVPATFVVAQNGLISARYLDPDYRQRMAIEDLLAALKAAART
jgi:peroxiredoxin